MIKEKPIRAVMLTFALLITTLLPQGTVFAAATDTKGAVYPIEVNELNFPDANFRDFIRESFGDQLDESEIQETKTINAKEKSIASLQGIEYFTALESLIVTNNSLTELDVSKNTALDTLWCHQNSLTQLDVSENTALQVLLCDNNSLTQLDVSKNVYLSILDCTGNQITELDTSNNSYLYSLRCGNNELTQLDVSNNSALTQVFCFGNAISKLDFSNNTLNTLNCADNQLTELNLKNNTALTTLQIQNNLFNVLDVSQCKDLEYFTANHNSFVSLYLPEKPIEYFVLSANNGVSITANELGEFDLSTLDKNINGANIHNLSGATIEGTVLKNLVNDTMVLYDYDTGVNGRFHVALYVSGANYWTSTLAIENWTYGEAPNEPTAVASYGTPVFYYSDAVNGTYTETVPTEAGTWFVKAVVAGKASSKKLESEPLEFKILRKDISLLNISDITSDKDVTNLVIKDGDIILKKEKDYILEQTIDSKDVRVTITGIGNYTGTVIKSYLSKGEDNSTVAPTPSQSESNAPSEPVITPIKPSMSETKPSDSPQTGDTTLFGVLIAILLGSSALLGTVVLVKRKKEQSS